MQNPRDPRVPRGPTINDILSVNYFVTSRGTTEGSYLTRFFNKMPSKEQYDQVREIYRRTDWNVPEDLNPLGPMNACVELIHLFPNSTSSTYLTEWLLYLKTRDNSYDYERLFLNLYIFYLKNLVGEARGVQENFNLIAESLNIDRTFNLVRLSRKLRNVNLYPSPLQYPFYEFEVIGDLTDDQEILTEMFGVGSLEYFLNQRKYGTKHDPTLFDYLIKFVDKPNSYPISKAKLDKIRVFNFLIPVKIDPMPGSSFKKNWCLFPSVIGCEYTYDQTEELFMKARALRGEEIADRLGKKSKHKADLRGIQRFARNNIFYNYYSEVSGVNDVKEANEYAFALSILEKKNIVTLTGDIISTTYVKGNNKTVLNQLSNRHFMRMLPDLNGKSVDFLYASDSVNNQLMNMIYNIYQETVTTTQVDKIRE